jgi:menaquinone-dependent protoporphyrinogen oxidase
MASVLVVYGTTEGHTRTVGRFVRRVASEAGHQAFIADATELFDAVMTGEYDLIVVAASVHEGVHQRPVSYFVRDSLSVLKSATSAFLSISLNAAIDDEPHRAEARQYVDGFLAETGWTPDATLLVGGALRYGKLDFFRRQILTFLLPRTVGVPTEVGDHDFTDYEAVSSFVLDLLAPSEQGG